MHTTSTAMTIQSFHHITLPVDDLDVAEHFYVDLLQAQKLRRVDRQTFLGLAPERAHEINAENSPLHLEVRFAQGPELHLFLQLNRSKPRPPAHPHLALWVAPDHLLPMAERLRLAGVPLDGPRRLGPPGQASVYFADPFGNTLELVTLGYDGTVELGPPRTEQLAW